MKYLMAICTLVLFVFNLQGQSDIQIIKIKNTDKSVDLRIVNHGSNQYMIDIDLELEGMKVSDSMVLNFKVLPKEERYIGKLTPTASNTKYTIHYKATDMSGGKKAQLEVDVPDITIYTKNSDTKSTELRMYLKENEIPFNEFNVSYNEKSKEVYEKMLVRRNIEQKKAKLPVVILGGEIYPDIKKMKKFIEAHLK